MKSLVVALVWFAAFTTFANDEPSNDDDSFSVEQQPLLFEYMVSEYRKNGITEVPVGHFPPEVAKELGLKPGSTIPVADFLKPEIQAIVLKHAQVIDGPIDSPLDSEAIAFPPDSSSSVAFKDEVHGVYVPDAQILEDPEILDAFRKYPNDVDALRAAIEKALPNLPPEQRKALSRGFQFPSEGSNPPTTMSFKERLPTEEVLALLTPSDQSVLKPYRKLLDNEVALRAAMASMSEEELIATQAFLSKMFKQTTPKHPAAKSE